MGYYGKQIEDLAQTINKSKAEVVVSGTPIDITKVLKVDIPVLHISYRMQEREGSIEEEVDNLNDDGAKLLETKASYSSDHKKLTVEAHIIVTEEISDDFGDRITQRIEEETGAETDLTLWIIVAETHKLEEKSPLLKVKQKKSSELLN